MADDPLAVIERCLAAGEAAYDRMYETRGDELSWQISLAKDAFRSAYRAATEAGLTARAEQIMTRLMHVKAVARQLR